MKGARSRCRRPLAPRANFSEPGGGTSDDSSLVLARRGASGLDIADGGRMLRPTSPAAWLLVRQQLQELGVKLISCQVRCLTGDCMGSCRLRAEQPQVVDTNALKTQLCCLE